MEIPIDLVDQVRRGDVRVCVGPGVSSEVGLPNLAQLTQAFVAQTSQDSCQEWIFPDVVEAYLAEKDRQSLIQSLRDPLTIEQISPSRIHQTITILPHVKEIITTVRDSFMETGLENRGVHFRSIIQDQDFSYISQSRQKITPGSTTPFPV